MHLLRSDPANKTRDAESIHALRENSPECRLYQWSIRIKCRYAVLNVCRERDIVRLPAPDQITPELPLLRFIREFNPAAQEIWSGPAVSAGKQWEYRPLVWSPKVIPNSSVSSDLCLRSLLQGTRDTYVTKTI